MRMPTVLERLGHPPGAKLLITNCADLGLCHAATVGVYDALREGIGTSASLIVPAPWARESASRFRGDDIGVQLTLNAEHDRYRWGPITQAPSLLDGDGGAQLVAAADAHGDDKHGMRAPREMIVANATEA